MICLNPASIADTPIIYQLAYKIWQHHYVPIVGQAQVDYMLGEMYSDEALKEQMTEKRHNFFFINKGSKNIGFISVSGVEDMFIHKFYIDQDEQGQGLGAETFLALKQMYPQAQSFTLTVNRQNYKSINFYFKLGFTIDHIADFDIGNGFFMNDFIMKWKLSKTN